MSSSKSANDCARMEATDSARYGMPLRTGRPTETGGGTRFSGVPVAETRHESPLDEAWRTLPRPRRRPPQLGADENIERTACSTRAGARQATTTTIRQAEHLQADPTCGEYGRREEDGPSA